MLSIHCSDLQFFSCGISRYFIMSGQDDITLIHCELQDCPRAIREMVWKFSKSNSVPQLLICSWHFTDFIQHSLPVSLFSGLLYFYETTENCYVNAQQTRTKKKKNRRLPETSHKSKSENGVNHFHSFSGVYVTLAGAIVQWLAKKKKKKGMGGNMF